MILRERQVAFYCSEGTDYMSFCDFEEKASNGFRVEGC